ncbi:hypothetical protein QAD02_019832 [Eretmocerus hayati]|uniref:Uncharacterized protein n=1 Tax=Eretmocerus hayati TaxID=131215 RepID=A0ACC2PKC7_9HYME|nr:hypothetical protein QAD02_019832 [Eretmocerus hayati]
MMLVLVPSKHACSSERKRARKRRVPVSDLDSRLERGEVAALNQLGYMLSQKQRERTTGTLWCTFCCVRCVIDFFLPIAIEKDNYGIDLACSGKKVLSPKDMAVQHIAHSSGKIFTVTCIYAVAQLLRHSNHAPGYRGKTYIHKRFVHSFMSVVFILCILR